MSIKSCIAVLTRGYPALSNYHLLIARNQRIAAHLQAKTQVDIVIFHEGNICDEHQKYISSITPDLRIRFQDISAVAFLPAKAQVVITHAPAVGMFWFVNFWAAVQDYDRLVRIDEDCFFNSRIDAIFAQLDKWSLVTGRTCKDRAFVTQGLNGFSLAFMEKYQQAFSFKQHHGVAKPVPSGPYTNVMGIALDRLRSHIILQLYIKEVDDSNMIYARRWGDLPLWGEVLHYILGNEALLVDSSIKYYHDSHKCRVN
jgi:hypothetical protein